MLRDGDASILENLLLQFYAIYIEGKKYHTLPFALNLMDGPFAIKMKLQRIFTDNQGDDELADALNEVLVCYKLGIEHS